MKLEDLKPAPYNPRRAGTRALGGLKYSMDEFGDISGIVWNKLTGNLVCGHQRISILKKAGAELSEGSVCLGDHKFAVRVVDWPYEKELAANVAANSGSLGGEFNDGLEELLQKIEGSNRELFDGLLLSDLSLEIPDIDLDALDLGEDDIKEKPSLVKMTVFLPRSKFLEGRNKIIEIARGLRRPLGQHKAATEKT